MGLSNALSEITLVLFTAIAPSGIMACVLVGIALLFPSVPDDVRASLNKFLSIPICVSLVGLVASATHLGTPGNALYVLAGVGRSPLSNEVFAGVMFLGLVGSYWLLSFSTTRRPLLERVWVILFCVAGLVFLVGIAFAYNVNTIVTWKIAYVPLNLILNALIGGPLIALCVFAAVVAEGKTDQAEAIVSQCWPLVVVAAVATIANCVGYALQNAALADAWNSLVTFAQLVPLYPLAIVAFAVLCFAGICIDALMLRKAKSLSLPASIIAAFLALAGIFVMRFVFYMSHMTVGVSF